MRKNNWPDGETMTVQCPRCDAPNKVQIEVVRENDDPARPDECNACGAYFEVQPEGSTAGLQPAKDQRAVPQDVTVG
jgi:transcription elongation factor Elf1